MNMLEIVKKARKLITTAYSPFREAYYEIDIHVEIYIQRRMPSDALIAFRLIF